MAERKYAVEGKPYRVKVLAPTICGKCRRTIGRGKPAWGVRRGLGFYYYHISHKPKTKRR